MLPRIHLGPCWSALPWVRSEPIISRISLAVFPLISFPYIYSSRSPSDYICQPLPLVVSQLEILWWMYMISRLLNKISSWKKGFVCMSVCGCMDVCTYAGGCFLLLLKLGEFLFIPTTHFLFLKCGRLYPLKYCALREPKEACFCDNGICNSLLES